MRDVNALERSLDSFEFLISISTVLVVVGLVAEYWFPLAELIESIKKRPPFPWKKLLEMTGGVLVTVGVAGELWFQSRASTMQTVLRSDSHQIEGLLQKEAADANREAGNARRETARLSVEAARLNILAEDERTAREQLTKTVTGRRISAAQHAIWVSRLKPFDGKQAETVLTKLADPEAATLAEDIGSVLHDAGWHVNFNVHPMMMPPSYNVTGAVDDRTPGGKAQLEFFKSIPTSTVKGVGANLRPSQGITVYGERTGIATIIVGSDPRPAPVK